MLMDLLIHEKASFRRWAEESEPFSFFFSFDPRSVLQVPQMAKIFTSSDGIHCKGLERIEPRDIVMT